MLLLLPSFLLFLMMILIVGLLLRRPSISSFLQSATSINCSLHLDKGMGSQTEYNFESRVCKRVWKMTWSEDIGTGFGQSGGTRQDLEKRAATLPPSPPTKNSEEYSPPRVCIFWKTIFVIDIVWFFSLGIN